MGDGRRELAHGGDARYMGQFALSLVQGVLGMPALGDVAVGFHRHRGAPALVALERPAAHDDNLVAAFTPVDKLALPATGTEEFGADVGDRCGKDRAQQRGRLLSDRLRARPAIKLLGTFAPVADGIGVVAHEDGVVRQVQQVRLVLERECRLAVLQREKGGDENGSEADQATHHGAGVEIVAVHDEEAEQGERDAQARNGQQTGAAEIVRRQQNHDDVKHRDSHIER